MEYKLGKTALLSVMKTLQDALLEGKDASQGLRDLRFYPSASGDLETKPQQESFERSSVGGPPGSAGGFNSEF